MSFVYLACCETDVWGVYPSREAAEANLTLIHYGDRALLTIRRVPFGVFLNLPVGQEDTDTVFTRVQEKGTQPH